MDRLEAEALDAAQNASTMTLTSQTRFAARLLCRMHKDWLGGIYGWAGRYRTVDVPKGGFTWPPAAPVPQNMEYFQSGLLRRHTPCLPGTVPEIARRMAEVHAGLLLK